MQVKYRAERIGDVRRFIGRCDVCGRAFDGPGNGGMPADKCPACGTELVDWNKR